MAYPQLNHQEIDSDEDLDELEESYSTTELAQKYGIEGVPLNDLVGTILIPEIIIQDARPPGWSIERHGNLVIKATPEIIYHLNYSFTELGDDIYQEQAALIPPSPIHCFLFPNDPPSRIRCDQEWEPYHLNGDRMQVD